MYYKIIDGQEVFSDCRVIKINQTWISNPTPEMIAEAGWIEYVQPVIPSQPQDEPIDTEVITAIKKMLAPSVESLTDEQALEVASLYPTWYSMLNAENPQQPGQHVDVGQRLWDDGELWKVITAHDVLENWRPKDSPSLFVKVSIEEWPEIPEYITAESAWMAGQKGTWKGQHYICQIDNCVWNPDVAPQYWQLVA